MISGDAWVNRILVVFRLIGSSAGVSRNRGIILAHYANSEGLRGNINAALAYSSSKLKQSNIGSVGVPRLPLEHRRYNSNSLSYKGRLIDPPNVASRLELPLVAKPVKKLVNAAIKLPFSAASKSDDHSNHTTSDLRNIELYIYFVRGETHCPSKDLNCLIQQRLLVAK